MIFLEQKNAKSFTSDIWSSFREYHILNVFEKVRKWHSQGKPQAGRDLRGLPGACQQFANEPPKCKKRLKHEFSPAVVYRASPWQAPYWLASPFPALTVPSEKTVNFINCGLWLASPSDLVRPVICLRISILVISIWITFHKKICHCA